MKNLSQKTLSLLLSIIVFLAVLPLSTLASADSRLELGYSPGFPRSISISGPTVVVSGVPTTASHRYLMLVLVDADTGIEACKLVTESDGFGSALFDVTIPNGMYILRLYHSDERYVTFSPIVYGDSVQIDWRGYGGSFVRAEMYNHNSSVATDKREDIAALTYYLMPSTSIQSDSHDIVQLAKSITAGITGDYDKAIALHDWVCNNIYYNYDAYYGRTSFGDNTAFGTLQSRTSVCEGYANLTAALFRAAGIPAKKIVGFALGVSTNGSWPANFDPSSTSNHAWIEAYLDGRWVIIDSTWNSNNSWEHGQPSNSSGLRSYRYFDISPEFFAMNHAINSYSETDIDAFVSQQTRTAAPFTGTVMVNGSKSYSAVLYTIDYSNYIMLRDAAAILNLSNMPVKVVWDEQTRTIAISTSESSLPVGKSLFGGAIGNTVTARLPSVHVTLNGDRVFLRAYSINGSTYFRLRDLGSLLGFDVGFDSDSRTIHIGI